VQGFVVEMDNSASELIDYFLKNRGRQLNTSATMPSSKLNP
jgi:hypothetical protein